jgi:SAM-dependent methyltransferase
MQAWWYYTVELLPGVIATGQYPPELPSLPRLMIRRCDLRGMSCLDLGSMEGLIPVLMKRGGAADVLATDAIDHCVEKLEAVQHYYNVKFEYKSVGLMYELDKKLKGRPFDLIHCSGLLYHVFSPLHVLCGLRPLVKRNGLMIVSTNVVLEDGYTMEFNNAGRMQVERDTFWYPTVKLLDYTLRYLKLRPLECMLVPHKEVHADFRVTFDKPSGYVSVLCRAVDEPVADEGDEWMKSAVRSWEYKGLIDWELAARQPLSKIQLKTEPSERFYRADTRSLDVWDAVRNQTPLTTASETKDSHVLSLSDFE